MVFIIWQILLGFYVSGCIIRLKIKELYVCLFLGSPNIFLRKAAYQLTTHFTILQVKCKFKKPKLKKKIFIEGFAVDGNLSPAVLNYGCSYVELSTWWACDMKAPYYIDYIVFYGRDKFGF